MNRLIQNITASDINTLKIIQTTSNKRGIKYSYEKYQVTKSTQELHLQKKLKATNNKQFSSLIVK